MFVGHEKTIAKIRPEAPGMANAIKQVLVGPEQGWEGWVMRLFTLGTEGHSPRHSHPWPHINYIVRGQGVLYLDGQDYDMLSGSVAYVPAGTEHQFSNSGTEDFAFICIVPEEGDK